MSKSRIVIIGHHVSSSLYESEERMKKERIEVVYSKDNPSIPEAAPLKWDYVIKSKTKPVVHISRRDRRKLSKKH